MQMLISWLLYTRCSDIFYVVYNIYIYIYCSCSCEKDDSSNLGEVRNE